MSKRKTQLSEVEDAKKAKPEVEPVDFQPILDGVALAHPELAKVFTAAMTDGLCIDQAFAERFPLHEELVSIKTLAPFVTRVSLKGIPENYVIQVLPCFVNVQELSLSKLKLKEKYAITDFPHPKVLHLELYNLSVAYAKAMLKHFGPHLDVLRAGESSQFFDLSALPNKLRELEVYAYSLNKPNAFFKRCKNLESLRLDYGWGKLRCSVQECELSEENFKHIAKMQKLKKLEIVRAGCYNVTIWQMPKMSQVEEFSYSSWMYDDCHNTFINGLDKNSLKSLIFEWDEENSSGPERVDMINEFLQFTKLETLKLLFDTEWTQKPAYLDKLMVFKVLKVLHLHLKSPELMLKVIKQMPQLIEVGNRDTKLEGAFKEDLLAYLNAEKRSLTYNSVPLQ